MTSKEKKISKNTNNEQEQPHVVTSTTSNNNGKEGTIKDTQLTDARSISPKEVFDSSKYNSMSDMTQGASLKTEEEVEDLLKDTKNVQRLQPEHVGNESITKESSVGNAVPYNSSDKDNVGNNTANSTSATASQKITPMIMEERAKTIREANEDYQLQPSSPSSFRSQQTRSTHSTETGGDMNTTTTIKQHYQTKKGKFILYLNSMLSIENAAIERLHLRIQECLLPEAKQQLIHHLEETREQKERLIRLISILGGQPTEERAQLPGYMPPKSLADALESTARTPEEKELKTMEIDALIEHAEVIGYNTIIQIATKLNIGEAIPPLWQSLHEEEEMVAWLRANLPASFAALWPEIEKSLVSAEDTTEQQPSTTRAAAA